MIVRYVIVEKIYVDNAATTKVDENVVKKMNEVMLEIYGNPSSKHSFGLKSLKLIDESRETISKKLNCKVDEIIFTSGGTESNNLALNILEKGQHLITTEIEHPAIYEKALNLEKNGVEVTFLKVDSEGFINLDELKSSINEKTRLISIMHANNEIGTIQDLENVSKIIKEINSKRKEENKILFHSDCIQSFNKEEINVKEMNLDMISISSHKIHGPKGIGCLYCKKGIKLKPLFFGGGQEFKLRSGTENVSGIIGKAEAIKQDSKNDYVKELRDYLIKKIETEISDVKLNGSREKRLCNNVNFSFKKIEGEGILMSLDIEGIYVSTGSACSSRNLKASRVLLNLGMDHATSHGSIRFSLSKYNNKEEIDFLVEKLKEIVERLRKISPL